MSTSPLQIGITGGIGSGKSLVCRIFALLGAPVYDADARARWLMAHHAALKADVADAFGANAYCADGTPNRPWLAAQVFDAPRRLAQLNALVHPRVGEDYAAWVGGQSAPYVLKEAALLYESGAYRALDRVIVVFAPEAVRMARVRQRDPQRSADEVRAIMARQMDETEKCRRADAVIHNDESQLLIAQVLGCHRQWTAH